MERDDEGFIRRQVEIMVCPFVEALDVGNWCIIKPTGDGALVEFVGTVSALRLAMAFQEHMDIHQSSWLAVPRIR